MCPETHTVHADTQAQGDTRAASLLPGTAARVRVHQAHTDNEHPGPPHIQAGHADRETLGRTP